MMKKYALVILSIILWNITCSAQQADTAAVFHSLFKCWHAVSHEYSPIYALEEDEIKAYSKQKLCLNRDTITMFSGPLYSPQFTIKKVNAENFARENFDCGKTQLGMLKDSVYQVKIVSMAASAKGGALHKMTDIIAFDGDFIYVVKDGVIFKLYDSDAKQTPRNSN